MSSSQSHGDHDRRAVVIGGGIAGLLCARVLLNHFDRVSLIERDVYPDEPIARSGVPQGHHLHMLFLRGQEILEQLFPGIGDKLVRQGAIEGDFANDYLYHFQSGWLPRTPSGLRGYACTRLLLEWQIRQELQHYQRLTIMQGQEVVGLLTDDERQAVTGVCLRQRTYIMTIDRSELVCDLVVDASGRFSRVSDWLEMAGYQRPEETTVDAFLGYATRVYAPPSDQTWSWKGLMIQSNPPNNLRTGFAWSVEGNCWLVLLAGTGKDYPPTDEAGFIDFAKELADPLLYQIIRQSSPLSPVYSYRHTANRLRHFERMKRYPAGFMVIGDACCALNPTYGQGMTVAALGAKELDDWLGRHRTTRRLAHDFQKRLAQVNAPSWQFATTSDYRVPTTNHPISLVVRMQHRYMDRLVQLMPGDPAIRNAFMEVFHLRQSPTILLQPSFLLKALRTKPVAVPLMAPL